MDYLQKYPALTPVLVNLFLKYNKDDAYTIFTRKIYHLISALNDPTSSTICLNMIKQKNEQIKIYEQIIRESSAEEVIKLSKKLSELQEEYTKERRRLESEIRKQSDPPIDTNPAKRKKSDINLFEFAQKLVNKNKQNLINEPVQLKKILTVWAQYFDSYTDDIVKLIDAIPDDPPEKIDYDFSANRSNPEYLQASRIPTAP